MLVVSSIQFSKSVLHKDMLIYFHQILMSLYQTYSFWGVSDIEISDIEFFFKVSSSNIEIFFKK